MVLFVGHTWSYLGERAWFYLGGMYGFIRGACVVLFGGAYVVLFGGMHGFSGGLAWFFWGGVHGFFSFFGYNEIRSMSARYASYWNAFLLYHAEKDVLSTFKFVLVFSCRCEI